jgi:hypothetical protein
VALPWCYYVLARHVPCAICAMCDVLELRRLHVGQWPRAKGQGLATQSPEGRKRKGAGVFFLHLTPNEHMIRASSCFFWRLRTVDCGRFSLIFLARF